MLMLTQEFDFWRSREFWKITTFHRFLKVNVCFLQKNKKVTFFHQKYENRRLHRFFYKEIKSVSKQYCFDRNCHFLVKITHCQLLKSVSGSQQNKFLKNDFAFKSFRGLILRCEFIKKRGKNTEKSYFLEDQVVIDRKLMIFRQRFVLPPSYWLIT